MPIRVLVPGAGTGPGNSLIRSLRAGDSSFVVVGCHDDRFVLRKSTADRNYLVPPRGPARYPAALRRIIRREKIDLLIPNTDDDVALASRLRATLPCRVFLPSRQAVALCQDKYRLTSHLGARGVPVPRTFPVRSRAAVARVFRALGQPSRVWCRIRSGSGSRGAAPMTSPRQTVNWIAYWREIRGVPTRAFTIAEYLPGRDFACQTLWKDGALVLVKTVERLSYFGGGSQPSGASSIAGLAKTVIDTRVVDASVAAVRALGRRVTGAFSVDLKENDRGVPCVTEINAGRFITMMNFFDLAGKHNMTLTYVRLALGEPVAVGESYDRVEDHYFVRDVDALPGIFHADELFEGVHDARG
jgi:glutathione synthase/RimK-type ligase-like ATP-grasp enzyme